VPIPDQALPSPSQGYGFSLPDLRVRADVTYLRQDFSLMQPVKNAKPWPDQQRYYDFLVRTREITERDADAYRRWPEKQCPYFSPQHQMAVHALRTMTGLDADAKSQPWRKASA
jgi:hypothetical protein